MNYIVDPKEDISFEIDFVYSIEDIDEIQLLQLSKNRTYYVSKPWLLAIERLRNGSTGYIIAHRHDGKLAGVLPIYWGKPSQRGYYEPYNRFLLRSGGNFGTSDWSPSLIVGSRAAYSCEFLIDENLQIDEQNYLLYRLFSEAYCYLEKLNAVSISALYINPTGVDQLEKIVGKDSFFVAGANTVIDIKWESFEEYMSSVNTKIRRERKVFNSKGYSVVKSDLLESKEILSELFSSHERKYGHVASAESELKELTVMTNTSNENSLVLLLKTENETVGGALFYLWGDTIFARSVGIHKDYSAKSFEYFNLVYYEAIKFAIKNGYKHIDYGMATYRAKLIRGARIEPLMGFITSRNQMNPLNESTFYQWTKEREAAIESGDASQIERSQIP
ncbi:GNAT family N-acetyltransferase [Bacillus sp. R86525]|uniref:GNAT family N-acetyltransferase n=1 Tax=Bacillus sp. R86525 TaxID=3101709 RepID=UPI0036729381